jgi:peptidoglycan/LPS O-acetylase OafA/YrhL
MKNDRTNNFNLLRFLFASLVIVSHASELKYGYANRDQELLIYMFGTITFGNLAVDGFFILSGFLILKSWNDRPEVHHFIRSRILRIYPGFLACSLVCSFIVAPVFSSSVYFQEFQWVRFLMGMLRLAPPVIPAVFDGSFYPLINAPMWSISYEFACYLLLLGICLLVPKGQKTIWPMLALVCVLAYVWNSKFKLPFGFTAIRCLMAFSFGVMFYLYRNEILWTKSRAILGLAISILFLFSKTFSEPALCVFGGYSILYFAQSSRVMFKFNRWPDISYGIYLYAWPINKVLLWYQPDMNLFVLTVTVFLISIAAGIISWYAIEKPFLKFKAIPKNLDL